MTIENKIKFLWDCSRSLVADKQTHKLLKSNYMNNCRNISKTTLQIPREKFAVSQMCPFCSSFWSESEFSLKLNSQQVANNSKTRKLIDMLDKSKDVNFKGNLSRKQINRAKWLKKRLTNSIEINCYQCKRKSLVKMEKPENKIKETTEINTQFQNTDNLKDQIKKPKKKKIKCERSGLKIPHENKPIISTPLTKSETFQSKPLGKIVNQKSPHGQQTSKVIKNNKVVSKTQKQNSVLQLATLLKNQSSSSAKNLAQKRLEALLK